MRRQSVPRLLRTLVVFLASVQAARVGALSSAEAQGAGRPLLGQATTSPAIRIATRSRATDHYTYARAGGDSGAMSVEVTVVYAEAPREPAFALAAHAQAGERTMHAASAVQVAIVHATAAQRLGLLSVRLARVAPYKLQAPFAWRYARAPCSGTCFG